MRAREVAEKIETVAKRSWEKSLEMPADEAIEYLQDALDVCRQLASKLVRAYETRAERNERYRADV